MKEIKTTTQITEIKYEAIDGTVFNSKEECLRYDDSANAVINSRYKPLVVKTVTEYDLCAYGCSDNTVDIVKLRKEEDITIILHKLCADNTYYQKNPDNLSQFEETLQLALNTDDYVLICRGYDNDNFYIQGTRQQFIDSVNKVFDEIN